MRTLRAFDAETCVWVNKNHLPQIVLNKKTISLLCFCLLVLWLLKDFGCVTVLPLSARLRPPSCVVSYHTSNSYQWHCLAMIVFFLFASFTSYVLFWRVALILRIFRYGLSPSPIWDHLHFFKRNINESCSDLHIPLLCLNKLQRGAHLTCPVTLTSHGTISCIILEHAK